MNSERQRFAFLVARDGLKAALDFELNNVIRTYRKTILAGQLLPYRQGLLSCYKEAKLILQEHQ